MSNEIKITAGIVYVNGNLKDTIAAETYNVSQTTQTLEKKVVIVGIAEEDLALGDLTANGFLYLRNLDSANFVKYGPKNVSNNMTEYGRLKAGEMTILRLAPGITHRWIADTASVRVLVWGADN